MSLPEKSLFLNDFKVPMKEKQKGSTSSLISRSIVSNERCVERIQSIRPDRPKGIAVVIHGLNLNPDKMGSMITHLTHSGIDVLKVSLSGHGKNYCQKGHIDERKARMETFKAVSYELWINETYQAFDIADKISRKRHIPLFFIGYSLGAVLGVDLFATNSNAYFNRMVLLAPALHLNIIYGAIKIFLPFPKLVIPSFSSPSYRANFGTPVAAYRALFDAIKHFHQDITSKLNIPTLVIIDPQDELVSYKRLKQMINSKGFDQWKLHLLKKSGKDVKKKPHHLIVDGSAVGNDSWDAMKHLIIRHLLS